MNEALKRATRAALIALYPEGCAKSVEENGRIIAPPELLDHALAVARAVLAEIIEPTKEMVDAVEVEAPDLWTSDDLNKAIWRAMAYALLGQETPVAEREPHVTYDSALAHR